MICIPYLIVDGHGGSEAAQLVQDRFASRFTRQLRECTSETDIAAEISAFGRQCESKAIKHHLKSGCCVLIAVLWGKSSDNEPEHDTV